MSALFIKRQFRLATEDVKVHPTLCRVITAALTHLGSTISDAVSKLKHGDSSGIEQANSSISSIEGYRGTKIRTPWTNRDDDRNTRPPGVITWRAGCGGSRTSGSAAGREKPNT